MTYADQEVSRSGAAPVELFKFQMVGLVWRYTSADRQIVFNNETYLPEDISRESVEFGSEAAISGMNLRIPKDNPVSRLFVKGMPIQSVTLSIVRFHRDVSNDAIGLPPAHIVSWDYDDESGMARVVCETASQMMERVVPKLGVRRQCAWALYSDPGCKVSRAAYAVSGTVTAIDGSEITLDIPLDHEDGWFRLGYIESQDGRRLFISKQSGAVMTLLMPPTEDFVVGSSVTVYPGCDRFAETCDQKFGNARRFMGWKDLPALNPFIQGVRV